MLDESDLIHSYTRKQALADGVLIDVTALAKEAGYVFPVAITSAVWQKVVVPSEGARNNRGQDEKGRIWDILWMLKLAIPKTLENRVLFSVMIDDGSSWLCQLSAICGPGDLNEPTITILFPNES